MIEVIEKTYSEKFLNKYRLMYPMIGFIGKPSDYSRFLINSKAILKFNVLSELKNIKCPVLIIGGNEDKIVGIKASYKMHELIKNSVLHVYQGLGHAAYEEAKDFNKQVDLFLEEK